MTEYEVFGINESEIINAEHALEAINTASIVGAHRAAPVTENS